MRTPRPIYLDYAATTPTDASVVRAMAPYFSRAFGNPGSLHRMGAEALSALDHAREAIASRTGAEFREVIFTASATEANNLALRGVVRGFRHWALGVSKNGEKKNSLAPSAYRLTPKLIVSAVEHDSVLETARDMERAGEIELAVISVDRAGIVDVGKLEAALDERTVLVSVMYVNNEIGTIQPIVEISKIVKDFKARSPYPLFHTDAAQAFLYYPCDIKTLGADLMTLSSQKIYGPKGTGALILGSRLQALGVSKNRTGKDSLEPSAYGLVPILTGGGQEFGLRAGTENIPNIVGFATAAELAAKRRIQDAAKVAAARDVFVRELKRSFSGAEENIPSADVARAPHIANLRFPGVSTEDLLVLFDREGIAASPGAACSARALTLSHVLRAIGRSEREIRESVRFSFGRGMGAAEARQAAARVARCVTILSENRYAK